MGSDKCKIEPTSREKEGAHVPTNWLLNKAVVLLDDPSSLGLLTLASLQC